MVSSSLAVVVVCDFDFFHRLTLPQQSRQDEPRPPRSGSVQQEAADQTPAAVE